MIQYVLNVNDECEPSDKEEIAKATALCELMHIAYTYNVSFKEGHKTVEFKVMFK